MPPPPGGLPPSHLRQIRCPPLPWQLPLHLAVLYPRDCGWYFLICFTHQTKLLGVETGSRITCGGTVSDLGFLWEHVVCMPGTYVVLS